MSRLFIVLFAALAALAAVATSEDVDKGCSQQEQRIADLRKEIEAASKERCQQPVSLLDPLIGAFSAAGSITSRIHEIGQQNEKIVALTGAAYEHSRKTVVMVADKVTSVDYAKHLQVVKDHEIYRKHVLPQVEKVSTLASGPLNEHVYPIFETAKDKVAILYNRCHEEAIPFMKTATSKAADMTSKMSVEKVVSPIFEQLEKIAPSHAAALPKKTADRVLLMVLALFVVFEAIHWGRKLFRMMMLVVRIGFKIVLFTLRIVLFIPVRLIFKILRITMCICTGFYCCGLCRRKQKAAELKAKAGKSKPDAKKTAETGKETKESNEVSVQEVCQYLEARQKEKRNLDEFAQQFALSAKSGKVFTQKGFKGKTITKDTLKKACAKFKEIDMKKLGL